VRLATIVEGRIKVIYFVLQLHVNICRNAHTVTIILSFQNLESYSSEKISVLFSEFIRNKNPRFENLALYSCLKI